MAAVAGYPHIAVPAGMVRGLLRIAYNFEQETMARRAPAFRPTAEV